MLAAALVLALAGPSSRPPLAPCAGAVRVFAAQGDRRVLSKIELKGAPRRGAWEIIAPAGSQAAYAYRRSATGWQMSAFEDEIPGDGHVFYSGPPALTVPPSWAGGPLYVLAESTGGVHGCIRAAPLGLVLGNEPTHVPLFLYFGLLGGTVLMMLVLFAMSREPFIGWYLAYLCSLIVYQLFRSDFLWPLAWPFTPWHEGDIEFALWGPNIALYAQFARSFLQTAVYARRIDRLLLATIVGFLLYLPAAVLLHWIFGVMLDPHGLVPVVLMCCVTVLVIPATIGRARDGYRPAAYFLLSYPVLFFFVSIALWQYVTHAHWGWADYGAEIGTGSECILLAYAVGDRLRIERILHRVVSGLSEVIVRIGRDGRILFATTNAGTLFGMPAQHLIGKRIASVLGGSQHGTFRAVARAAIASRNGDIPAIEIPLENPAGATRRLTAAVHAERDGLGKIQEIQLCLRPAAPPSGEEAAAHPAVTPGRIGVSVYRATLTVDGTPIALTDREIELLAYLALQPDPLPSAQVAATLWPDHEPRAAASTLQTTISRLRKKLPPDTLPASRRRYALGTGVSRDVDELHAALRAGDVVRLEQIWPGLKGPIPAALAKREWFAPYGILLENMRREASVRLGEAFLARGDIAAVLGIAADLRRLDVTDETGYGLAIQAHLLAGQLQAARRLYDDCRRALERELGVAPSPQFNDLCRPLTSAEL